MIFIYSLINMLAEMAPYLLLGFLISGVLYAFVPGRFYRNHLSRPGVWSVMKAALIGVPLPLCSCGVLPTAVSLRRNGASRGAATSFLIATPQTGLDSIAATYSLLGPAFAIIRPVAALATAFMGGMMVNKWGESCTEDTQEEVDTIDAPVSDRFIGKIRDALRYGLVDMIQNIGKWLVIGLVIAAAITVFVPDGFFTLFADYPLLSMIAVVIVAVPMYVCSTGSIPIALSLMIKGLSPGTALVLLMAGPAANFASFTLISREMGRKSAIIYLASIVVGAMTFGLIIDYVLPADWFTIGNAQAMAGKEHAFSLLSTASSAVLVILLVVTFIKGHKHNHITVSAMTKEYTIKGMNCSHCQATVAKSISSVKGVKQVDVNLSTGIATVEGEHNAEDVVSAVRNAGFDVVS